MKSQDWTQGHQATMRLFRHRQATSQHQLCDPISQQAELSHISNSAPPHSQSANSSRSLNPNPPPNPSLSRLSARVNPRRPRGPHSQLPQNESLQCGVLRRRHLPAPSLQNSQQRHLVPNRHPVVRTRGPRDPHSAGAEYGFRTPSRRVYAIPPTPSEGS